MLGATALTRARLQNRLKTYELARRPMLSTTSIGTARSIVAEAANHVNRATLILNIDSSTIDRSDWDQV